MSGSQQPNVLWICTDQQRFDTIGALGNPHVRTPNLDRLAEEGIAFTNAYCQHAICQPSRASFMTGRYPSTVHVNYNGADIFPKRAEATLVSRLLAEAGYDCGLVGKLHIAACQTRREPRASDGFRYFQWSHSPAEKQVRKEDDYVKWLLAHGQDPEEVLRLPHRRLDRIMPPTAERNNVPPELHPTTWAREKSIEFLRDAREPWLLCVNMFAPHPPFNPPWEYYCRYDPDTMPGPHFRESDISHQRRLEHLGVFFQTRARHPDEIGGKVLQACYYAMIELIDDQLGKIISFLESAGKRDNTVVLFTSDHGEMLGDHGLVRKGCRLYEGAVRVPFIWSWPERFIEGICSEALVELIDIAPTLLELAGRPVPELMQGRSLLSILNGTAPAHIHRESVRSEYFDPSPVPKRIHATMYRDLRWKLVAYHSYRGPTDMGELYDLQSDPWEFHDLWDDPACQELKLRLLKRSFDACILARDPGPPRTMSY